MSPVVQWAAAMARQAHRVPGSTVGGRSRGTAQTDLTPNERRSAALHGNKNASVHDLFGARAALTRFGSKAIDGRSSLAVALREFRASLVADLGGNDSLSAQQHAVIDVIVKTKLLLDGVDAFILSRGTIVRKRTKELHPIVLQRQKLADSLVRHLETLGHEKKAIAVPDLKSYIASKEKE